MMSERSFLGYLRRLVVALIGLCAASSAFAAGPGWYIEMSPAKTPIARLDLGGIAIRSIEFACDGGRLALAILPQPGAPMAKYPLLVKGDAEPVIGIAVPRTGNLYLAYLPDTRIPDGIVGKWRSAQIAGLGGKATALSGENARTVFAQALAGCYRLPAAGAPPTTASPVTAGSPGLFADASLPPELRRDLADFDSGCATQEQEDPRRPGQSRTIDARPAIARPDAIRRADFNGDGKDDYLLDTSKLKCSKLPGDAVNALIAIYVSRPDGSYVHSFDANPTSYRIVGGKPAALFIHQDEDDETPLVNQTLRMTPAGGWPASDIGIEDYRGWQAGRYPREIVDLFAGWERQCGARGLRLVQSTSNYNAYRRSGAIYDKSGYEKAERMLDLNGDGRQDYVIEANEVSCGNFQAVRGYSGFAPLCDRACNLIAIVSKPDGGYVVDRVPEAIGLDGNGDTTSLDSVKGRSVICYGKQVGPQTANDWRQIRVSYTGTTRQTLTMPPKTGCDGVKYE